MLIKKDVTLSNESEKSIKIILILLDVFLLIFSLSTGASTIFSGLNKIINSSSALVTDYLVVGGISASFFNAFLVTTVALFYLFISKVHLTGVSFASVFMVAGFALFGKNIMNIIPILLGVSLYAGLTKVTLKDVVYVGLFGTALGPIVSEVYIQLDAILFVRILVSYLFGIFIGLMLTPVSQHVLKAHKGFDLYNIGFTDGIVAISLLSVLRIFGFDVAPVKMSKHVNDLLFFIVLIVFSLALIIYGVIKNPNVIQGQINLNKESGRGLSDFIHLQGLGSTLTNMGLCCLVTTVMMYLLGAPLNGPIFGTILAITGFCACGDNLRNISFIYIAALLGHFLGAWDIANNTGITLATLLGTGLAPIGGYYGIIAGIISGLLHISLVQFTGPLHLGLNLYNNGFAAGLVAMFLVPLFELHVHLKRKFTILRNLPKVDKKKDESIKG